VTDSGGKPVANASISATSNAITGGQIGQFTNSGQADANGFYSLTVLSGTGYTVTYTPVTQ